MDVVASSGGYGFQANRYIAWTVGEPLVQTLYGPYTFTQGFHQPDPCGLEFVGNNQLADWGLHLFPNPTDGLLAVRYSVEKKGHLVASAFDILGRPMFENQTLAAPEGSKIDATAWPAGVYFLLLQDPNSKASATLRIVRL